MTMKLCSKSRIAALLWVLCCGASVFGQDLPNIIIIYADDLGYGDLSSYNPKAAYKTPRLDRMAAEGIRFTDAHSPSTICSPSRYGLYSGQQVYRTGRGSRAFEGPGSAGPRPMDWHFGWRRPERPGRSDALVDRGTARASTGWPGPGHGPTH